MMVDFETGHYGDPAFDLGFFLSHLVLKACYHIPRHATYLDLTEAFQQTYSEQMTTRIPPERTVASVGAQHPTLCRLRVGAARRQKSGSTI